MHENIVRLRAVANILKGLEEPFVFVGGATVSLYAGDEAAATDIRPTVDVDVIVELASYGGYSALEERLFKLGFENDIDSSVICRYRVQGLIVDIMPASGKIIGFSNRWYPDGFKNAIEYEITEGETIRILSLPYFVASKWEAHLSRGKGDLRSSKDFEDIVYILENVPHLVSQLAAAPDDVRLYLKEVFSGLISSPDFEEGLLCHMEAGYYEPNATASVIQRLKEGLDI